MCLTNNSIKICGTLLSFYESKPKKQRGFRWCVRTRATILFTLYAERILPSDTDRLPIPRLRAECNILQHDPAWAFVLPYFDKLVQHYATKWVKEPCNGALVSWCAVSGCYRWDEQQTAGLPHGGVDAVEAWMRQTLGKTHWWQGEQAGLVEQFGSMSLQAPSNSEKVPPQVNNLNSPATDSAPAPETLSAWASLEHDPAFNPWDANEADEVPVSNPVTEPVPPVVPTPVGPTPEAFTQALEMHRAAQRMMVEAEMAMREHGLFGYVGYVQ
ncbi:hypothetical protein K4K48_008306 [Colletotrichum sp. SAR 10_66]|nr:hypothetical protein K4K48_008306 [Colletotrichum sp. SAR 10_66]